MNMHVTLPAEAAPGMAHGFVEEAPKPALPTFRKMPWHSANRLDARPLIWCLKHHPEDFEFTEFRMIHKPSKHEFWIANGPFFFELHEANCGCMRTSQKFQLGQKMRAWRAYRRARNAARGHDAQHWHEHFVY